MLSLPLKSFGEKRTTFKVNQFLKEIHKCDGCHKRCFTAQRHWCDQRCGMGAGISIGRSCPATRRCCSSTSSGITTSPLLWLACLCDDEGFDARHVING